MRDIIFYLKIHNRLQLIFFIIAVFILTENACCIFRKTKKESVLTSRINKNDSTFIAQAIDNFDTAQIPIYEIQVNFHFIGSKDGNFYPGESNHEEFTNGAFWAKAMVNHINHLFKSFEESKTSTKNFLGDSHIRVNLYSENIEQDSFQGAWYWPDGTKLKRYYNDKVLHVLFYDKDKPGDCQLKGYACGLEFCNQIVLYDAFDNAKNKGGFGFWAFASLFNHELGHILGLCHAFYCENPCNGIDLDVKKECGTSPCFNDCGGPNSGACSCWDIGSRNMMGYNANNSALTPCQWKIALHNLNNTKVRMVKKIQIKEESK